MEKFRTVLDLHLKHHSALGYGLVSLLTAGGERIFSTAVFQCPCNAAWNLPYGLVFLLVPALALFLLGYVLNARTWRLLTGCCARPGCGGGLRTFVVCAQLSAAAAVAPLTWVAVALLGGTFYECAASGSAFQARRLCPGRDSRCEVQMPLVPCGQAQVPEVQELHKELKAQSQEQQILKNQATEHAAELAKENIRCFFESSHPKECNTPSIKDWQQISSLYTYNPKEQYYSMLHKYVNRKEKNQSIRSSQGDAMVPIFGFVDSTGMNTTPSL